MLNPLVFAAVDWLIARLERRGVPSPASAATPKALPVTQLTDHTILVGYGRVGNIVGNTLKRSNLPFLVIEVSDSVIGKLKESNVETIMGNAAQSEILAAANLASSRNLVIAIPEAFEAGQIVQQARAASANIRIIARAHSDAEVEHLKGMGADIVIMGEREIARGMIEELETRPIDAAEKDSRPVTGGSKV
jgi:CPA2 family monovalent cation:H+ antiporter-2